jgi:hypothetical protein
MRLWPIRIEVLVRLLARLECSCQPNAKIPIYIMIAGYDEQAALRQIDSGQQLVEEFSRDFVFLSFTGMCDSPVAKIRSGERPRFRYSATDSTSARRTTSRSYGSPPRT